MVGLTVGMINTAMYIHRVLFAQNYYLDHWPGTIIIYGTRYLTINVLVMQTNGVAGFSFINTFILI